jgi:hypothetical protein
MVRHRALLLTLGLFVAAIHAAQAQQPSTPARLWGSLDALDKTMYLRGYVDGGLLARAAILTTFTAPDARGRWFRPLPAGAIQFDSMVTVLTHVQVDVPNGQFEPAIAIMDQLYADPANACLYLAGAALWALRKLNGWSTARLDSALTTQRAVSAPTCGRN